MLGKRGECLIMYDRDGNLFVKVFRARNRFYKVRMGLKEDLCLYFILWEIIIIGIRDWGM